MENRAFRIGLFALRVALGAIFVYAAYRKITAPWQLFAGAIMDYQVVPDAVAVFVARTLPWAELALGVLLIAGFFLRTCSALGSAIMAAFLAMMARAFFRHMEISCGCFGPTGDPISWLTLGRDGAILAAFIALTVMSFLAKRKADRYGGRL